MKKFLTRAGSGLIYAGVIVGSILGGRLSFFLLVMLRAVLASIEFTKITQGLRGERKWMTTLDIVTATALAASSYADLLYLSLALFLVRFIAELYSREENPLRSLAYSLLTIVYIGGSLSLLLYCGLEISLSLVLAMFIFIWINDTGAYIVGCQFGKHRLFERISPKKSWEGFFGGLGFNILFACLFCGLMPEWWGLGSNYIFWVGLAIVVTMFSTWGDLVESLMKRTLNLKDSGNMIPGHGGILDRIDSLLAVAPAVAIYMAVWQTVAEWLAL